MDKNTIKGFAFMVGVGVLIGMMFNTAISGNPINLGGVLGGFITGILMYSFS